MAENDSKRYYWLKLKKDFFKRHDIRILEKMPNGKDYVLFYLKLMCESTSHCGELRFSDLIPYSEEMLSTITDTNIDIVRQAIKILLELKMIEILDNGTIFIQDIEKLIGSETGKAERMRIYRNKIKGEQATKLLQRSQEIDIDIEKDIEKDNNKHFTPPTVKEVEEYCKERNNNVDANRFIDFYTAKGWFIGKNKIKDWKACVRTWEKRENKKEIIPTYNNEDELILDKEEVERLLKERGRKC